MFGQSINLVRGPKTQTYRAHRLLYNKVGHSTVLTLCILSTACTHFEIDETFYPEYHSGQIWIQTVFANGERERERLVQAHQSKHSIGGSTSRERERERESVCVLFEFRQFSFFFYSVLISLCRS